MKKLLFILLVVFAASCATGPKHGNVGKTMVLKAAAGPKKAHKIKVWEHRKRGGTRPFAFVKPGDSVLVVKFDGAMALIELPGGKRGWIRKVFVPVP